MATTQAKNVEPYSTRNHPYLQVFFGQFLSSPAARITGLLEHSNESSTNNPRNNTLSFDLRTSMHGNIGPSKMNPTPNSRPVSSAAAYKSSRSVPWTLPALRQQSIPGIPGGTIM